MLQLHGNDNIFDPSRKDNEYLFLTALVYLFNTYISLRKLKVHIYLNRLKTDQKYTEMYNEMNYIIISTNSSFFKIIFKLQILC